MRTTTDIEGEDGGSTGTIDGGENMEGMAGDMDTVSFEKLVDTEIGTAENPFTLGSRDEGGNVPAGVDAVNVENVIGTDEDDML